ncbi:hypothetical protein HZA55_07360 [Candidatus Poribacteria bacterium]|nr:hypothetical protein [Candidatus Poribacteria bacterium]
MNLPDYITIDEVKRVCKELNIRDWTSLSDTVIPKEEASIILNEINTEGMNINIDEFCKGLEVELEHGVIFKDCNVTNNHPVLTGKIVMVHMKESLDYYKYLEIAELEFDLLKAVKNKNMEKIEDKYKKLAKAKHIVTHVELDTFKTHEH